MQADVTAGLIEEQQPQAPCMPCTKSLTQPANGGGGHRMQHLRRHISDGGCIWAGNHDYGDNCDHAESEPPGCSTAGRDFYSPLHQVRTLGFLGLLGGR